MDDIADDDPQNLFGIDALEAGALAAIFGPSPPPSAPRRDQPVPPPVVVPEVIKLGFDAIHGQGHAKRRAQVHIEAARNRGQRPGHILVTARRAGLGVSHVARLIAAEIDEAVWTVHPTDPPDRVQATISSVPPDGVLLVDDIERFLQPDAPGHILHLLGETGGRTGAGPTVVGATSDLAAVDGIAADVFALVLELEEYSDWELALVAAAVSGRHWVGLPNDTLAKAGQVTSDPRDAERLVLAARDLRDASGEPPTFDEITDFLGMDDDGLDRRHREYLDCLFNHFAHRGRHGTVYEATEAELQARLGRTSRTLHDIETALLRREFITIEAARRHLTSAGVLRARQIGSNGRANTAANGVEHAFYDDDPSVTRDIYLPYTCTTCGLERDIIDFHDGLHSVNIVEYTDGREHPVQFVVDHGERARRLDEQQGRG